MKNETRHSCLNATRIVINVKITLSPDMAFLLTYQLVFSCTSTSSTYTTGPPLEFVDFTDLVDGLGDGLRVAVGFLQWVKKSFAFHHGWGLVKADQEKSVQISQGWEEV